MRSRLSRQLGWLLDLEPASDPAKLTAKSSRVSLATERELRSVPKLPPEFSWPDYTAMLLHVGGEIEHALMVEYLYAAYSLGGPGVPEAHRHQVREWQETILGIAKEEMGHLISVQNLLRFIGAPLALDREDYPWGSDFYPFDFTLEPLTKGSLAKYVCAEAPADWAGPEAEAIKKRATEASGRTGVNRVGVLYSRIQQLFADDKLLPDSALRPETVPYQASWDEWGRGYQGGARGQEVAGTARKTPDVLVNVVSSRDSAVASLDAIGKQGEAFRLDSDNGELSHFRRFLDIYRRFPEEGEWSPIRPMPVNPRTAQELNENELVLRSHKMAANTNGAPPPPPSTLITHPESVRWAHLFNLRFRMLLTNLQHSFFIAGPMANSGAITPRGSLINRTFGEMYNLRAISGTLVQLPLAPTGHKVAGPTFEMPYTLELPGTEPDRWRLHRDLIDASLLLIRELKHKAHPGDGLDYLRALESSDCRALEQIQLLITK